MSDLERYMKKRKRMGPEFAVASRLPIPISKSGPAQTPFKLRNGLTGRDIQVRCNLRERYQARPRLR
jgi:hypothetical protein